MIGAVRRFLGASVARRLFVLFVLSAFVPLAVLAVLSISQVRALLLQQGEQRLAANAKSYGMSLFERLLIASDLASATASRARSQLSHDALAVRTFRSLLIVAPQSTRAVLGQAPLPSFPAEAQQRVAEGKTAVFIVQAEGAPRIWLAAPLSAGPGMAVGELNPDYLWGLADEMPAATEYCVVEDVSKAILYCPTPLSSAALRRLATPSVSTLALASWERDGEIFIARAWTQYMRAGLGTADWIVIASQPEEYQLARVLEFRRVYIPVVLLALLLVTWFTIRQSRNIVAPVEQLAERARGIARNDFDSRLDLQREDEFGELASAFDQMSRRLGRQFASLNALAEIDRLILSTQDTAQVVRAVLFRMADVLPADMCSVTLFDHDNPDHAHTYYRPRAAAETMSMERHEVAAEDRLSLVSAGGGAWIPIPAAAPVPAYLSPLQANGMANVYAQAITWRGAVSGVLALGFRGAANALGEEDRQQVRELADRVAVAVSSAWRDEQLYLQSHYDPLTRLPNRLLFKDRIDREIARSQRENISFALLFIDLDHFKTVNDSLGHTAGDEVLCEAARRISRSVRDTDSVSRLGGDEFTVLLTRMSHAQEAWVIGEAIVEALSQEFTLGEQSCYLSASIGIASYPDDGQTAEALLRSADTAMYRAKASGRSQAVFFEERMNAEAVARVTLDRDLRAAIERGELVMHYQPQIDLRTGSVLSAEALVRWNHPVRGLIPPVRFIPLAEESGFIEQLGRWTLQRACAQMKEWRAQGLPLERVSVNVSPRQFRKRAVVDFIRHCVEEAQLPASCLEIEITEGLLLDRGEAVEGLLGELAAMGHQIALDDFGTGFSSMSYLKRFPVHTIKIDRVFIEGLDSSADSDAIVAAIIAMSHALGKKVIAEGVETQGQLAILRRLRCDRIQGFLMAPALPPQEFAELVRERAAGVALA